MKTMNGLSNVGDSFKEIEDQFSNTRQLVAGEWGVVRLDGHGFSRWVRRNYPVPSSSKDKWHPDFELAMSEAALAIAKVYHPSIVYVFSDEVSLAFAPSQVMGLNGGRILKLCTLMSSMMTAKFAQSSGKFTGDVATFDARAFSLRSHSDVAANISWRMCDARRNSVAQWARQYSSTKELHGLASSQLISHTEAKGAPPWLSLPTHRRCGRLWRLTKNTITMSEQDLENERQTNPEFGHHGLEERLDSLTGKKVYVFHRSNYKPETDLLEDFCKEPPESFWFSPQTTIDRLNKIIFTLSSTTSPNDP